MRNEELYEIPFSKVPPLGECPKDKGGAVSGEEAVAFATGGCCQSDPTTLRPIRQADLPPPLGKGGLNVCLFHGDSAQKMP